MARPICMTCGHRLPWDRECRRCYGEPLYPLHTRLWGWLTGVHR